MDEIEGDDQAGAVFAAAEDAFESGEGSGTDANAAADGEIRMRLGAEELVEAGAKDVELIVGEGDGRSTEADEFANAGNLENDETIVESEAHENVAGEERLLDGDATVAPAPDGLINRKKVSTPRRLISSAAFFS